MSLRQSRPRIFTIASIISRNRRRAVWAIRSSPVAIWSCAEATMPLELSPEQ